MGLLPQRPERCAYTNSATGPIFLMAAGWELFPHCCGAPPFAAIRYTQQILYTLLYGREQLMHEPYAFAGLQGSHPHPQKEKLERKPQFFFWWAGWDSNPQALRQRILSPSCIPFHHPS